MKRLLMFMALMAFAGMVFYACGSSSSGGFYPVGPKATSTLYFAADDGYLGGELYKTRGTSASTALVNDINVSAATGGVLSSNPWGFEEADGTTYFVAFNGTDWVLHKVNDSGEAEEVLSAADASVLDPDDLTDVNGTLYLTTDVGTKLGMVNASGKVVEVKNSANATVASPSWLTDVGGTLYLTDAGTMELAMVNAAGKVEEVFIADGTTSLTAPSLLTDVNGWLYLNENNTLAMVNAAGNVVEIVDDAKASVNAPDQLMEMGGMLYLVDATDLGMVNANGVYVTIEDDAGPVEATRLTDVDGTLYIEEATGGLGLVNAAGIVEYVTTNGTDTLDPLMLDEISAVGSKVVFEYETDAHGSEPWILNSVGRAELLKEINTCNDVPTPYTANSQDSWPNFWEEVNGVLYFTAVDCEHGRELWRTQGTASSTMMVKDIDTTTGNSDISGIAAFGTSLIFDADAQIGYGDELWISDGVSTASMVKDISPGSDPSNPSKPYIVSGTNVFFEADTFDTVNLMVISDGTEAGTTMLVHNGGTSDPNFGGLEDNELGGQYVTADNTIYFVNSTSALMTVNTTTKEVEEILIDGSTSFTDASISMDDVEAGYIFASEGTAGVYLVKGLVATEVLADVGGSLDPVVGIHDDIVIADSVTVTGQKTMYVYDAANNEFVELLTSTGWALGDIQGGELATNGKFYIVNASTTHSMFEIDGTTFAVSNVAGADVDAGTLTEVGGTIYWLDAGGLMYLDAANAMAVTPITAVVGSPDETTITVTNSTTYVEDTNDLYLIDFTNDKLVVVGGAYTNVGTMVAAGDALFFFDAAGDLYAVKGDLATIVTDGTNDVNIVDVDWFEVAGGKLFLRYDATNNGLDIDLAVVDPATDATLAVNLDVNDNPNISNGSSNPQAQVVMGGKLYFEAYAPAYGWELWMSDGTAAGTSLVVDIDSTTNSAL